MAKDLVALLEGDIESEKNVIAEKMREAIVDSLVAQNPIPLATGRLASSIEVRPTEDGFEVYAEDWWKWVEYGRKGHGKFPPIQPLKEWIQAKGIKPRGGIKPENLVWAIATRLKTSTIKPRPFLEQGLDAVADDSMDKLFTLIEEAVDNIFE